MRVSLPLVPDTIGMIAERLVPRSCDDRTMLDSSARLLRMLSLLQGRSDWSAGDLADRLGVTTRTVRKDVDRLRALGYPIDAKPGVGGGYRLGAGASLPPLLLEDDEAVAVAVGLRTAAGGSIAGIEEPSIRALAKLDQVLPSRLRHWIDTLRTYVVPTGGSGVPPVDLEVLTTAARACRNRERLRFDYRRHDGSESTRDVEPHRLVWWLRRWYLVAWDTDRQDWRTFRVDRIRPRIPAGPRFEPRDPPDPDIAAYVARGTGSAMWDVTAIVIVHASAASMADRLPPAIRLREIDEGTCEIEVGADTPQMLAVYLGMLDADFEVEGPPELVAEVRNLSERYARATNGS
jgi:predicted DNA-binding transcriptional regulator YafY